MLYTIFLEWNAGQRMSLFMAFMSVEIATYIGWLWYVTHSAYAQLYVNVTIAHQLLDASWYILITVWVFSGLFWKFQNHTRLVTVFEIITFVAYSVCAAYVGYLVGEDNIMSAIAVSTAGMLMVLFSKRYLAYIIVALNIVLLFSIMYASHTQLLPPSTFYIGSRQSVFWVYTYLALCASKVVLILLLTDNILTSLKANHQKIKFISEHDALTGLLNRAKLQDLLAKSLTHHQPVAVVMLDLDHFKHINDNYGHLVGDKVLIKVAELLHACTRQADYVGRFGGEEFLVVLPNTSLAEAETLTQRIFDALNELKVLANVHQAVQPKGSFGVTATNFLLTKNPLLKDEPEALVHALLESADDAMYQAKSTGRNHIVSVRELTQKPITAATKDVTHVQGLTVINV